MIKLALFFSVNVSVSLVGTYAVVFATNTGNMSC